MAKKDEAPAPPALVDAPPTDAQPEAPADGRRTVEEWFADSQLDRALLAAVKAWHGWPIGLRLSEAEFKEAVARLADPKHEKFVKFGG